MEYLSLHSLSIFKKLYESRSYTNTAKAMNISQPAVSGHIKRLQEYLNVKLFNNQNGRKLMPTQAADTLYEYALQIELTNREIKERLNEMESGTRGSLSIALSYSRTLVTKILADFCTKYPDIKLTIRYVHSDTGKKLLANGEVDFGIFLFPGASEFITLPLFSDTLNLVCHKSNPLAYKEISREELVNCSFITCHGNSDYNQLLSLFLSSIGNSNIRSNVRVEDGRDIIRFIENGYGIGLLAESATFNQIESGQFIKIKLPENVVIKELTSHIFFNRYYTPSSQVRLLINYIINYLDQLSPYIKKISWRDNPDLGQEQLRMIRKLRCLP